MHRCEHCKLDFEGIFEVCPECGGNLKKLCSNDTGSCNHGVVDGAVKCELCGEWMCPICGSHDVEVLSRTTGYYGPLSSFGSGKKQEFEDRTRYEV